MKLIILDRDGVINFDSKNYIKSVDEWQPIPGSVEAISRLTMANYTIGVATNQSGIARGLYSEAVLSDIHQGMCERVEAAGGRIDKIVFCPHHPDSSCACRKPKPKMLQDIADHFDCGLADVSYIGDRRTDIEAALAAGAKPVLVHSSMTINSFDGSRTAPASVPCFNSLSEAVDWLLKS